jgi:hypothetical protein
MRPISLSLLAILVLGTACDRRDRLAAPDSSSARPAPAAPARSAYLSVSTLSPEAGASVVVAATVKVDGDLSLGSYRVRLGYDPTMLHFLEEVPSQGMMRVVNPQSDQVIVVGASSSSSSDGRLFTLRFRVDDPAGLNSLVLRIDELNDGAFLDQKQTVTRASRLQLDSTLAGGRVVPR